MFGDVAGRVRFDEEVEIALVFVRGDGSVGSDDFLGLAGDGSGEGDVLADREAEDVGGVGELEAVDGRIMRENRLLFQLELLELIGQQDLFGSYIILALVWFGGGDRAPYC
jgi:hypothetical protein